MSKKNYCILFVTTASAVPLQVDFKGENRHLLREDARKNIDEMADHKFDEIMDEEFRIEAEFEFPNESEKRFNELHDNLEKIKTDAAAFKKLLDKYEIEIQSGDDYVNIADHMNDNLYHWEVKRID